MKYNKKSLFFICLILFYILIICLSFAYEAFEEPIIDPDAEYHKIDISTSSRLGNFLSCYFYSMGLSFLRGKKFQTIIEKTGMFTDHFPEIVDFDKSVQDAFISAGLTDENLKEDLDTFDGNCHSAWNIISKKTEMFWTIMKPTINRIYKDSLEKSDLNKTVDAPVIHFRCSDSPINRLDYYHFQKYNFFKDAMDMIEKKTGKKYNKIYVCYCNTHISSGNICDTYSNSFVKYLESLGYEVIVKCQSLNEDFATMFYAPGLISTSSSLSFMAGYFSDGVFTTSMFDERRNRDCQDCDDWYFKGYSLKHAEVEDYLDSDKVISMLR